LPILRHKQCLNPPRLPLVWLLERDSPEHECRDLSWGPRTTAWRKCRTLPWSGEALIKVEAAGICASDLKCYRGAAKFWGDGSRPAWAEAGAIPGHEFVGTVVQLDAEARRRCWNQRG
jgi:threonine dehydrogenase-like Zn-dependent dehydrogenase